MVSQLEKQILETPIADEISKLLHLVKYDTWPILRKLFYLTKSCALRIRLYPASVTALRNCIPTPHRRVSTRASTTASRSLSSFVVAMPDGQIFKVRCPVGWFICMLTSCLRPPTAVCQYTRCQSVDLAYPIFPLMTFQMR